MFGQDHQLPLLIPISQSKQYTGLARSTAYRLAGDGVLDLRKIGNTTYITSESLRAYLATIQPEVVTKKVRN